MKAALVLLAVLALAGCKDQTDKAQADISKGNPEGGQMKKKYEEANKEAAQRRESQDK